MGAKKAVRTVPILILLIYRQFCPERLEDDFGHGLKHALKVAADAGALSLIEGRRAGYAETRIQRISIVSQATGLLHDIHRKQKDHAVEGARYARDSAQKLIIGLAVTTILKM
jgi:HD superfamily phosphodiesterase